MSETKTYVFGNDNASTGNLVSLLAPLMQQRGLDPNLVMSMMNNRGGYGGYGDGMWFMWMWFIVLLWGGNGNGFGFGRNGQDGTGYLANMLNNDSGRELLSQAIANNGSAISQLSTTIGCSIESVKSVLSQMQTQMCQLGNQIGMSAADVKAAVTQGNMAITQQLASCCCDIRESVTKSNYDNQIATLNQTNQLQSAINSVSTGQERGFSQLSYATQQQTCDLQNTINAGIQRVIDGQNAAEKREMAAVISKQNEEISSFRTAGIIGQQLVPITSALSALQGEVNAIKCAQPNTVTVPYQPFVTVPNCVAWNYGYNGFNFGTGNWA